MLEPTVVGKGSKVLPEGVRVEPGDVLFIELSLLHRDPSVWPEPEKFDPDRFSSERATEIPHNAWKPDSVHVSAGSSPSRKPL